MLIRVTSVDLGNFAEGKMTIEALEDVFSLDKTDLNFNGSTDWQSELKHPTGVQDYDFMEMPYEIIPEKNSFVFAMAAKPDADIYGLEWLHDDIPISGSLDLTAARKGSKVIVLGDEILAWSGIKQLANGH